LSQSDETELPRYGEDVIDTLLLRRQEIQLTLFVENNLAQLLKLLPIPVNSVDQESLIKEASGRSL